MEIIPLKKRKPGVKNDGELSIYFFGTGSAFSKNFFQTNFLIVKGENHLAVDVGNKWVDSLTMSSMSISEINNYYITHSHADHIGGLEEVMLSNRYIFKKKPKLYISPPYQKILWEESLKGGCAYSEKKQLAYLTEKDFWSIRNLARTKGMPRETWKAEIGNLSLLFPRTMHFPEKTKSWKDSAWSTGVIIDEKVLMTGDTLFDFDLLNSFDEMFNLEYIFHDCQFFPGGIHAFFEELKELPSNIKQKLILIHYGDSVKEYEDQLQKSGFHSFAKQHCTYVF